MGDPVEVEPVAIVTVTHTQRNDGEVIADATLTIWGGELFEQFKEGEYPLYMGGQALEGAASAPVEAETVVWEIDNGTQRFTVFTKRSAETWESRKATVRELIYRHPPEEGADK